MKKTKFFKIKFTLHYYRTCPYEGSYFSDNDYEEIIEETTRVKAIKFLISKYSFKEKGVNKEIQDVVINQVIDL